MKINETKTKTAIFNTSNSKDFTPTIKNLKGKLYNHTEHFKLLDVDFVSDIRKGINYENYIQGCIRKAYKNLWILKRLIELGVSMEYIVKTYKLRLLIHVEQHAYPLDVFTK